MNMFDPSKLDLDLDNTPEKKQDSVEKSNSPEDTNDQVTQEPIQNTAENQEKQSTETPEEQNTSAGYGVSDNEDVLGDITPVGQEETVSDSKSYGTEKTGNYDKDLIQKQQHLEQISEEKKDNITFDINISSLLSVLNLVVEKEYDLVGFEPQEDAIRITFRKDKVIVDEKYIKFPVYNQILLKAKSAAKLKLDVTDKDQEGKSETRIKAKSYDLLAKTYASPLGEKLFLKLVEKKNVKTKKAAKKTSLSQLLAFLGAGLFSSLVIGGAFLAFVLFNSNNVGDLTFFNNLGVNVASIKDFTSKLVDGVFFSIIFIETIFLFVFTFKAMLTKKEFKQKKIGRIILSVFFLILVLGSSFLWLTLSNKINGLKSLNYGKVEYFDNDKYLSEVFDKSGAQVNINQKIIGPINLRFNIEEFVNKLIDEGFKPQSITWVFGDEEIEKPIQDNEIIRKFDTEGVHSVIIKIDGINLKGESETIETEKKVNVDKVVNITERTLSSGGSIFDFDASALSNFGKIKWYYIPDLSEKDETEKTQIVTEALSKEVIQGNLFTSKIIFDEEIILGLKIVSTKENEKDELDKIFILTKNESDNIEGEITYSQSIENDLEYTIYFKNPETEFGNGVIEEFQWKIGEKTITQSADLVNLEKSSQITYEFDKYGEHNIGLTITDSRGQAKSFSTTIDIPNKLKITKGLTITDQNDQLDEVEYDSKLNEYYINEVGVPTTIKIDGRILKTDKPFYTLKDIEWDFDSNGDIDQKGKLVYYDVNTQGNHTLTAHFTYVHRKKQDDIISVTQKIFIEGVKKDAILKLDIEKDSNYVPIVVKFDASKSQIKDENIVKFVWDYGDGISEERDAIVPGHKYTTPGDYNIKLTVVSESGKEYSLNKKLILKPRPQSVKITSSMKQAPTGQGIDFLSDKSEGQIISYFWEFGDGAVSTQANPTHYYQKAGEYTVKLKLEFSNNNVLEDTLKIEITED